MQKKINKVEDPFPSIPLIKQMEQAGNNNPLKKEVKVSARFLTKEYDLGTSRQEKINAILNPFGSKAPKFWALKGINFDVFKGDAIGVIGTNGSGKSTLLNILSSALIQTSGDLKINGKPSLLSVWDGLRDNLTGLENIRLKSLMMGKTNKQIDEQIDEIAEFSELGDFIDQPVKNYSSGMRSKLGFSIAIHQDPDILIIDEALSVGDQTFQKKARDKIKEFKKQGKTIFFVSHALGQIEEMTDKTIWIQFGDLREYDTTKVVMKHYKEWTSWFNKLSEEQQQEYTSAQKNAQAKFKQDDVFSQVKKASFLDKEEKSKLAQRNAIGDAMTKTAIFASAAMFILWIWTFYEFVWRLS